MKKSLSYLLVSIGALFSFYASADQALDKPIVEQFAQTTEQIREILKQTPGTQQTLAMSILESKEETLTLIDSLPTGAKIKSTIKAAGYDDTEQYLDTSLQMMGAIFSAKMKQLPNDMTIDDVTKGMQSQLEAIDARDIPDEAKSQMAATINKQIQSVKKMKAVSDKATPEDVEFVSNNMQWLMQKMPQAQQASAAQ